MAIVYRVENWEGFGPYSQIAPSLEVDHEYRPEPTIDELSRFLLHWVFGFDSLTALGRWFSPDAIEALGRDGEQWLVSKYELRNARVDRGRVQLAFDKDEAELIGCLPLSELLKLDGESPESLTDSFSPHAPCMSQSQHSAFAEDLYSGIHTEKERQAILSACFENFIEGCYYRINRNHYRYERGGLRIVCDARHRSESELIDPKKIRGEVRVLRALRPPGTKPPKRDSRWTASRSAEAQESI